MPSRSQRRTDKIPETSFRIWLVPLLVLAQGLSAPRSSGSSINNAGPLPVDIAAWTAEQKEAQRVEGRKLQEKISAAIVAHETSLKIAPGNYRLSNPERGAHLNVPAGKNLTIDFQNSTVWLETEQSALALADCENVTLKNVIFDWDPVPFVQGAIVGVDSNKPVFEVKLDHGYGPQALGIQTKDRLRGALFDRATRQLKPYQAAFGLSIDWEHPVSTDVYRVTFNGFRDIPLSRANLQKGDLIAMWARTGRAIRISHSQGCVLENVTLYSSPFVGFLQNGGTGTTFRHCNIVRRPDTNRLIGGNADGFNCNNMLSGPTIEDCRIEAIGDDCVNVHSQYSRVLWQPSPKEIVATRFNYQGNVDRTLHLEFYDRAKMRLLGKGTAHSIRSEDGWKVQKSQCLADLNVKFSSGEAAKLRDGATIAVHRIFLDEPFEIKGDTLIVCEEFSNKGTVVRGCNFSQSLSRGIRLQSPGAIIENNTISMTGGSSITLGGDPNKWGEGPYVCSTTVRGNTLSEAGLQIRLGGTTAAMVVQLPGDWSATRPQYDIRIEGNVFGKTSGPAIMAGGVDGLTITGNHITNYGSMPPLAPTGVKGGKESKECPAILVEGSINLNIKANTIEHPGPYAQKEPVIIRETGETATAEDQ